MMNRVLKGFLLFVVFVVALVAAAMLSLPYLNDFDREEKIALPCLKRDVKVVRDEKGMAYIYAADINDLIKAQGYVTAQDRIFQMELTRLFATGRISELVGEKGRKSDIFMRTVGFYRHAKRHERLLDRRTRLFLQNYVDGINGWIKAGRSIPIEFAIAGIKPKPWTITDSLAILYFMGWNSAANIQTEVIAQMLVEKLGETKAREIFPLNVNPDARVACLPNARPGPATASIFAAGVGHDLLRLFEEVGTPLRIGSNNWATSGLLSASGKPIVANDPHLDALILPGPWYPCGLILPKSRAVGASIPGIPGLVVGRNDHIAVGVTNAYGDTQDLYIETEDPLRKGHYLEGDRSIPFQVIKEKLLIKDRKAKGGFRKEEVVIRLTRRGPVITDVLPNLTSKKVITLRWAPLETMLPSLGVEYLLTVKSVDEMQTVAKRITPIMLNFVFADKSGHIGWQVSGRLPIRAKGDGTVPLAVTDDADDWVDWVSPEMMPQSVDPERGWVGTCNHLIVDQCYPYYYSSYVSASWRYRRLSEVLDKRGKKTVDDHWRLQRDATNVMARQIAPIISNALLTDPMTKELGEILRKWDHEDAVDQAGPVVFHRVYEQFVADVFADELGEELCRAMIKTWDFWQERVQEFILAGHSEWFDDIRTPNKEGRDDLFLRAAKEVLRKAREAKEKDPRDWRWGENHQVTFVAPLFREGILSSFLGAGTYPMAGASETLYRASYVPGEQKKITLTASLRMVADLADTDKIAAVLPGGVSARQFTDHFADQTEPFMKGDKLYWWFSDKKIKEHQETQQVLSPR